MNQHECDVAYIDTHLEFVMMLRIEKDSDAFSIYSNNSSQHSFNPLCAGEMVQVIDDQVHQIQYLKDTIPYR